MDVSFAVDSPLYQMAMVLVAGIIAGELFGRVHLPKVTGWISVGILLRATSPYHGEFTGLGGATVGAFKPYMNFVLGYIAFTVGAALHIASLRNSGSRLRLLLIGEAICTPVLVWLAMSM